jgi:5'-nucleotidase
MATILVTNDDGILAEGLWALADKLAEIGTVYVVAPDRERSAIGHAVTMTRPLRIKRYGERAFMVDGTPADCVKLALETVLPEKPDLIASGINNGPNLGTDIFYSGTFFIASKS